MFAVLRWWLAAAALCLAGPGAASPTGTPRALLFQQLGPNQGFAAPSINAIAQDRWGYLWFAGQGGLFRYDGYRATAYSHDGADPGSLSDDLIEVLHIDAEGRLWVGTLVGLDRYDPRTDRFEHFALQPEHAGGSPAQPLAILDDGPRALWVGTTAGLQHLDLRTGRVTVYRHGPLPDTVGNDRIQALLRDPAGGVWIAHWSGLDFLPPGGPPFQHLPLQEPHGPQGPHWTRGLAFDTQGHLWIGGSWGLQVLTRQGPAPSGTLELIRDPSGQLLDGVIVLRRDTAGRLWAGLRRGGLLRIDAALRRWDTYKHLASDPRSLAADGVLALHEDQSGSLWIGTVDAGLSRIDLASGGFDVIAAARGGRSGANGGSVNSIAGDAQGRLWVATDAGVDQIDPRSGELLQRLPAGRAGAMPLDGEAAMVRVDRAGQVWVGTSRSLNRVDTSTGRAARFTFPTGEPASSIAYDLIDAEDGGHWIGSLGGLHWLDAASGRTRSFRHDPADPGSLLHDYAFCVHRSRPGELWVGTQQGLDRLDLRSGRFTHYRHDPKDPHSLAHNLILGVVESSDGRTWVLTRKGLSRLVDAAAPGRFDSFPSPVPLTAMALGSDGRLWLGTDQGLAVFDPATGRYRFFAPTDGLPDSGISTFTAHAAADGTLYFGTLAAGLVAFRPEQVHDNPRAPQVQVTDLLVFNRSARGTGADALFQGLAVPATLSVAHRLSMLSFEFAAMHYADPLRNRYAYRLRGFDKDWISTDASRRVATYTNLDPGDYVFEVRAANKDGVWSETPARVALTVLPPWWMTWWFRMLAAAAIAGLAAAAYRVRVRALLHRRAELEAEVSVRTAQLRQAQQQLVLQEKMASVGTLTAGIAHEINNPANFAHAGAQALAQSLQNFRAFLLSLAEDAEPEVQAALSRRVDDLLAQAATVEEGTDRIGALVKQLRAFARPVADAPVRARIGDALRATLALVKTQYRTGIDFITEIDADPEIDGWPEQLDQVFMNLAVNACQAIEQRRAGMPADWRGRLRLYVTASQAELQARFEDNGIGMAPDVVQHIFEPFYSTKEVGLGVGLGLSISFGIVERHGGRIEVASTEGQGTCMTLHLPLATPAQAAPGSVPPVPTRDGVNG